MMMGVTTKPVELFNVKISSLKRDFTINTEVTKVHKRELLSLENPRYKQCLDKYEHLKGVEMDNLDNKNIMPVNLILGTSDYARIKTETAPRIGALNEPVAEKTKLGVRARGGDLTNFEIFCSNSPGWETKGQSKVSKKPPPQGKKSK